MNKYLPTDINKHPLLRQASKLCQSIERLPASPENTNLSMRASELLREIWLALPEQEEHNHVWENPDALDNGQCKICGKTVGELLHEKYLEEFGDGSGQGVPYSDSGVGIRKNPVIKIDHEHSFMADGAPCSKCGKTVSELLEETRAYDNKAKNSSEVDGRQV